MTRRTALRFFVLVLFALTTINSWMDVLRSMCYDDEGTSSEALKMTVEDPEPVISALRDAATSEELPDCRKLFSRETHAHSFSMSEDFRSNVDEFLEAVNLSSAGSRSMEGHSFQVEAQYRLLHYLASKLDFVQTVCETGFNAGHSSFNFLTARRDITVHSFDIGSHQYAAPMASYLQQKFPGRLNVEFGDSRRTVPRYFAAPTSPLNCDLIMVDGGHSFDVALSDIRNLARIASPRHNILIVDDVNMRHVRTAWKVALRSTDIGLQQIFVCSFVKPPRAFAIAVVSHEHSYSPRRTRSSMLWTGLACSVYICLSIVVVSAVVAMVLYT